MIDSTMPYYQAGLGNRLCYEIRFNEYGKVINASKQTPSSDAEYEIKDIALEYEIVTQPDLAIVIGIKYQNMALKYDRILRDRKIIVNKSDTTWNWSFNMLYNSLKVILVLFEEKQSYVRDTSKFYNPKIKKYPSS